jgi:hypothetical protein
VCKPTIKIRWLCWSSGQCVLNDAKNRTSFNFNHICRLYLLVFVNVPTKCLHRVCVLAFTQHHRRNHYPSGLCLIMCRRYQRATLTSFFDGVDVCTPRTWVKVTVKLISWFNSNWGTQITTSDSTGEYNIGTGMAVKVLYYEIKVEQKWCYLVPFRFSNPVTLYLLSELFVFSSCTVFFSPLMFRRVDCWLFSI